jgi:hypothetical protein
MKSSGLFCRSLDLGQEIIDDESSNGSFGNVTNVASWKAKFDDKLYSGQLRIESNFTISNRGDILMNLQNHLLLPDDDIPPNIEEFVGQLQRKVPIDLFDPDGLYMRHTVSSYCSRINLVYFIKRFFNFIHSILILN